MSVWEERREEDEGGGRRTGRALEVEDAVVLEHVDLFDGADALDVELLELVAELGVVLRGGLLGDHLAADGSLAAACWAGCEGSRVSSMCTVGGCSMPAGAGVGVAERERWEGEGEDHEGRWRAGD